MGWRRYFTPVEVDNTSGSFSPIGSSSSKPGPARNNYSSFLPEVYTGAPNRIDRYLQYATMDMDSEITAALDILAEFCSQPNDENLTPFTLQFKNKATNSEIMILREYLQHWSKLQQFTTRIFKIVRNTFKNGDCFFIRDPENQKWYYIDPTNVVKVIVNESDGKKPEQYVIKGLSPNFQNLVVTTINPGIVNTRGSAYPSGGANSRGIGGAYPQNPSTSGSRFGNSQDELAVDAKHIIHISLSEGIDNNYPFGTSLLESVFKVYKQKELLEDAIIIYRIQRAPERTIFYIDVGSMPSHLAMSYVERVKNEIHQRRIPSSSGGVNTIDSAYNPLSVGEDFYFPSTSEGRGSKVETLPGGCLAMDTEVYLIDGRTLTIKEISEELALGKTLWTYSCHPMTGDIVPGIISWAGVTQESAKVLQIGLENGGTILATPDHKFPILNIGGVRADLLSVGDCLIGTEYDSNLKITDITELDDPMQVGTLTIDQHEVMHDYHTFAISPGVFTFNSNLGEIADLQFFTNKLFRGLRIPSSYLPIGAEDSQQQYTDGRVGTAYIQELRFNKYCERLQNLMQPTFDDEFKLFLSDRGVNIDHSLFEIKFQPPQNFASYRQAELDNQRIPTFTQILNVPIMSKRFALKRFLGMTDEEMAENERLWAEENGEGKPQGTDSSGELRNIGLSQSGIQSDMGLMSDQNLEAPEGTQPATMTEPSAAMPPEGAAQ